MTIQQAHCNNCGGERNHDVMHSERSDWEDHDTGLSGGERYDTIKCLGCNSVKLKHVSWFSEDYQSKVTYFPPSTFRREPEWFGELQEQLPEGCEFVFPILREIYVALQNGLLSLATMGVRALLERIMISQSGDLSSFNNNINAFVRLGHISEKQGEHLRIIIEAGHAAMHRAYSPEKNDVITLLNLTEHIIASVFLHGPQIERLRLSVPAKTPKIIKEPTATTKVETLPISKSISEPPIAK